MLQRGTKKTQHIEESATAQRSASWEPPTGFARHLCKSFPRTSPEHPGRLKSLRVSRNLPLASCASQKSSPVAFLHTLLAALAQPRLQSCMRFNATCSCRGNAQLAQKFNQSKRANQQSQSKGQGRSQGRSRGEETRRTKNTPSYTNFFNFERI